MKTVALVLALCLSSFSISKACDDPHPKPKVVHRHYIKRDTTHIPFIVFDTVHQTVSPQNVEGEKQQPALFVSYNSYSYTNYQPVLVPPQSPVSQSNDETSHDLPVSESTTSFHPFITAGLHAEPHYPATWSAGIGLDLTRGGFEIECAATVEPTLPQPIATTYGEQQTLSDINTRVQIATVVYAAIRYLF